MALRITGLIAVLIGGVIGLIFAYGAFDSSSMTTILPLATINCDSSVDVHNWAARWRLTLFALSAAYFGVAAAGVSLLFRRTQGLLWISGLLIALGTFPWLFVALGTLRYEFEYPTMLETVLFVSLGFAAALAYFRSRKQVDV